MNTAKLLWLIYQLRTHRLGEWSLLHWGKVVGRSAIGLILAQWLLRGRPAAPLEHWAILLLILAVVAALTVLDSWASRRMYVIFSPQPAVPVPAPQPLNPQDKVAVSATGEFTVEEKTRLFADLPAYWRTFASREHAIMAIVHDSRFLLLGRLPEHDLGMWYIFFTPKMCETITPGALHYGSTHRPALRITYRHTPPATSQRKPPKPTTQILYLGFADMAAQQTVWADLLSDER